MKIVNLKYIKDYQIKVIYENQSEHIFDFADTIKEFVDKYNKFHELLKPEYFSSVRLNTEWNTIEWDNGFDVCPDLLQPVTV